MKNNKWTGLEIDKATKKLSIEKLLDFIHKYDNIEHKSVHLAYAITSCKRELDNRNYTWRKLKVKSGALCAMSNCYHN